MKQILGVAVAVSVGALAGCSHPPVVKKPVNKWVYSTSHTQKQLRQHELALLRAQGIQVFIQGETVTIVLPNEDLFVTDSANLSANASNLLNHVSKLIKTYSVVKVNVSAYSDNQAWAGAPHDRKLALTNKMAQTVASYLWQSGIDMRFISAKGYSSQDAVAWNGTPKGRNDNQRVEVTFHFYPHYVTYN